LDEEKAMEHFKNALSKELSKEYAVDIIVKLDTELKS
jgi:hypothetical protein